MYIIYCIQITEQFEDTDVVIRNRISKKYGKFNGQKKKDERPQIKTKD